MGTAQAGSTVTVTQAGAGAIGSITTDVSGNWGFDYTGTTLAAGSYTFTATATTAAGGTGPVSSRIHCYRGHNGTLRQFNQPAEPDHPHCNQGKQCDLSGYLQQSGEWSGHERLHAHRIGNIR